MEAIGLKPNYYALMIAVFGECTPEKAFYAFEKAKQIKKKINNSNPTITKEDEVDMYLMKNQGFTYKQIGKIYGISETSVYRRVKRTKEHEVKKNALGATRALKK